jgi:hypothetical protein
VPCLLAGRTASASTSRQSAHGMEAGDASAADTGHGSCPVGTVHTPIFGDSCPNSSVLRSTHDGACRTRPGVTHTRRLSWRGVHPLASGEQQGNADSAWTHAVPGSRAGENVARPFPAKKGFTHGRRPL